MLGDLAEEFHGILEARGLRRARLWYWSQVVRSVLPLMTSRHGGEGVGMTGLGEDVRSAIRLFLRAPRFAAVVVLTIGIGVGGSTAVFSVVRGVLLSPLSFPESDRVVLLWGQTPDYGRAPLTVGDHNELARGITAFESVAASWGNNALLLGDAEPEQVSVGWVTPEYFRVLGVQPVVGRTLRPQDSEAVLLAHALWTRRYGADPSVVGRVIDLDGVPFEVAGILPPDANPNLTSTSGRRLDHQVWRLQPRDWTQGDDRSVGWLRTAARLREGVGLAAAQTEVDALMERVNATITDRDGGSDLRVRLVPVREDLVGGVARTLWVLLAAVCGVLLIAATNVAHLMLVRAHLRTGEVAVRTAVGGRRARLIRQFLVEAGVLAMAGGVVGLGIGWLGVRALLAWAPSTLPRLETVRLDPLVLVFAFGAAGIAAVLFGVVPALRASRADLSSVLGERTGTPGLDQQRLSQILVVAEVALSLGLLVGTGLLLRSFWGLHRVDLGFEREGLLTFALESTNRNETAEEAATALSDYMTRIEAVPGVRSAAFTNRVPLGGGLYTGTFRSEGMVARDAEAIEASYRYVTPSYFETLGARLVAGRTFLPEDGVNVVVVDQTVAERAWPGQDALGKRIETSAIGEQPTVAEVAGVVAPMKHDGVAVASRETVFLPLLARAHQQNFLYAAVRVEGEPTAYVDPIREVVRAVDPNAVIARIRTMDDLFDDSVASTRFAAMLLAVFGGVAVVLTLVGLYGVMAFSVRRRAREFGLRVALGAEHGTILHGVLHTGVILLVLGIAAGTALALGLGRVLSSLLFEVGAVDPVVLGAAAIVMLATGLLGAYLPARIVLAVDPAVTLRQE